MRWLITRPRADGERMASALTEIGHEALVCPLMEVRFTDPAPPDWSDVQAVLATSRHGIAALARLTGRRDVPVFAVGNATAATARDAGFTTVESAEGDADALVALVRRRLRSSAGGLVRVRGTVARGGVVQQLTGAGFQIQSVVAYKIETAGRLPIPARHALTQSTIDGALFFSPRSAMLFARLVDDAALGDCLSGMTALCLSPAIAKCLDRDRWRTVRAAGSKDLAALVALAQEIAEEFARESAGEFENPNP